MKRIFEIEFPDHLGERWMNVDNLFSVMFSDTKITDSLRGTIKIRDLTGESEIPCDTENCMGLGVWRVTNWKTRTQTVCCEPCIGNAFRLGGEYHVRRVTR